MPMNNYLIYKFEDTPAFVNTFDEQPLWSAAFGLLLLRYVSLRPNMTLIDLGSGTGFPLIEIAERLGASSKCYGIDPWLNANARARQKLADYNLSNVEIIDGSGEKMPFDDASVDLIVSNLGINNFEKPHDVFKECSRVLKRGGRLALTTNLIGHWQEFYDVFAATLQQLNKSDELEKVRLHQEHRGTTATVETLFTANGFRITRLVEEKMTMRFLDGSAFLNHHFVKLGWLSSWRELVRQNDLEEVFIALEANLNAFARTMGGLALTVPMAYVEGEKV
jgi:ubiquinone/menaquinone biosynthesis C-methylase UbiE